MWRSPGLLEQIHASHVGRVQISVAFRAVWQPEMALTDGLTCGSPPAEV
jgi:hypothetical protein